ncbi:TetR family transcriptional regulator [Microbacterium sp. P02]|uniref:TetR/AcrR family transcriptional regulator n=1 Tax=Microbacterium sp. P02 TaxID=3366260 RepID=UPI00366E43FA
MPEYAVPTPPRRRGRPKAGESDAQARIVAAAIDEFGELGYDGATMRGIAVRAGVDSALVHHYFGTKADLFAHTVGAPMRPEVDIPALLDGPDDGLGERFVRYILESWERPEVSKRGVVLLRAALGNRMTTPLMAAFLQRELIGRIATRVEAPDAAFRSSLVASQIAGLLIARYVLQLPALAEATVDDLVERVGPTVQRYLFD